MNIAEAKLEYNTVKNRLIEEHKTNLKEVRPLENGATKIEKENHKVELKAIHTLNKVRINETKNEKREKN